jgi:hypothetical protein
MDIDAAGSIVFRPFQKDDLAFVLDSWGKSFYSGCKSHKSLSPEEFHSFHRPIRERFFSKPNTCVIVAAEPHNDQWLIMGWIAVENIPSGLILQYIYVRKTFKKEFKIAEQLIKRALPTSPVFYTHLTDRAARIIGSKPEKFQGFQYLPSLV